MSNVSESPLVKKLLDDKKYEQLEEGDERTGIRSSSRERHYARMRYAVKQYGRLISRFGESIYEQAAEYDLEHSKSPAVWEPQAYIARRLHSMHRMDATLLAEDDFRRLVEAVNGALRHMAVRWADWEDMLALLRLYLLRAEVAADRAEETVAIADLRHAAAVLRHYVGDQELMIKYFVGEEGSAARNGGQAEEGQQLLLTMLWLQQKLLGKAVKSPVVKTPTVMVGGINGRADVYQAIEAIRVHDSLYEAAMAAEDKQEEQHQQKQPKEHWQAGGNFQMTKKATLTNDPNAGRCWKATEAIDEGEAIMFERPQVVVLFEEQFSCYCDHCHRRLVTFWPCSGCTELTYCSAECAQAAFGHYHHAECGIYGFIMNEGNYNAALAYRHYATFGVQMATQCEQEWAAMEVVEETSEETGNGSCDQPMADFFACQPIHSKPYSQLGEAERKVLCKALTGQLSHRGHHLPLNEIYQTVRAIILVECLFYKAVVGPELFLDGHRYAALLEHIAMSIMRTVTNAFSWDQAAEAPEEGEEEGEKARVGCATALQASLFNHCCDPNIAWTITEGVLHMEAIRAIAPGEELTISYGPRPGSSLQSRQLRLRRDYIFDCRCALCRSELAQPAGEQTTELVASEPILDIRSEEEEEEASAQRTGLEPLEG